MFEDVRAYPFMCVRVFMKKIVHTLISFRCCYFVTIDQLKMYHTAKNNNKKQLFSFYTHTFWIVPIYDESVVDVKYIGLYAYRNVWIVQLLQNEYVRSSFTFVCMKIF